MPLDKSQLQPLENWLERKSKNQNLFPQNSGNYFDRYWQIKEYCDREIYAWIGAGTSAEDNGIYTDHSIDHFNSVIKYAGELLGLSAHDNHSDNSKDPDIGLNPYEVFMLLVSILLHDAGNVMGRRGHEKRPLEIFQGLGSAICPDNFEARTIAKIAEAHGGKAKSVDGGITKDTIRNLNLDEESTYRSIRYRPRLISAIVRFADEICEDRGRAARFLINKGGLPKGSEIYHYYANTISSVDVDRRSKRINIKYELDKKDVLDKKGKDDSDQYLVDEINVRLEKMFCELHYCKSFMAEVVPIKSIRATISIYDDSLEKIQKVIELAESGYPSEVCSIKASHPEWSGEKVKQRLASKDD